MSNIENAGHYWTIREEMPRACAPSGRAPGENGRCGGVVERMRQGGWFSLRQCRSQSCKF